MDVLIERISHRRHFRAAYERPHGSRAAYKAPWRELIKNDQTINLIKTNAQEHLPSSKWLLVLCQQRARSIPSGSNFRPKDRTWLDISDLDSYPPTITDIPNQEKVDWGFEHLSRAILLIWCSLLCLVLTPVKTTSLCMGSWRCDYTDEDSQTESKLKFVFKHF